MVVAIGEIVDEVSSHRIHAIVEGSLVSPLASSCEISLESWSTCVQVAHGVSIIGPALTEALFQSIGELFKRRSFGVSVDGLGEEIKLLELLVGDVSAEDSLHDVGSVETVHAVGSHVAILFLHDVRIGRVVERRAKVEAIAQIGHKVPVVAHVLLHYVNKLGQILPFHLLALAMEVKPGVVEVLVAKFAVNVCELVADPVLAAFAIDQIDEVLLSVNGLGISEVLLGGEQRRFFVLLYYDGGRPLQVGLHTPHQGDGAADLHEACHGHLSTLFVVDENVLSLNEIGGVAIRVKTPGDEASAGSSAVLSRNEGEVRLGAALERRRAQKDIPKNARHTER